MSLRDLIAEEPAESRAVVPAFDADDAALYYDGEPEAPVDHATTWDAANEPPRAEVAS